MESGATSSVSSNAMAVDPLHFRNVVGHLASGVTITATVHRWRERAIGFMHRVRVALLIEAVRGDRNRRGLPLRRHALQLKTVVIKCRQD